MGRARNRSNPADRSFNRKAPPRIAKRQLNQQNYNTSTLRNKKRGQNQNGNSHLQPKPFVRRNTRKRSYHAEGPWGTPVPDKVRALSPVIDENGITMSKEQQEVFYRNKVDAFNLKMPSVSQPSLDSLSTKNILAIVAGLTEEEPTTSTDSAVTNTSDDSGVDIVIISSKTNSSSRKKVSPKLPRISLEEGEIIDDDDVICLSSKRRLKKNRRSRKLKAKANRFSGNLRSRKSIDLIELDSDSDDSDSVICLDDHNSEKDFANLSITTERVQESITTSKEIVQSQNGVPKQVIIESENISKTTTTVTASVTQNAPGEKNMGVERVVRHYLRSVHPLSSLTNLTDHLDSLSYFTAKNKRVTLRSPEFVGLPPLNINYLKVFRVASYNVLCQATMERTQHLYRAKIQEHPEWFLWENRWKLLSLELKILNADIYCLQEVERDKVQDYYEPFMVQYKKWKSFYTWRGGELNKDGCAVFWNPLKFECLQQNEVHLNHGVPNLDKPNVAQILQLKHILTQKEIVVVNTHILFNPRRGDIKLYQLAVIFANIQKIRTKNQPIIFCGDFNLEHDSMLYKFITDGELDCAKMRCYPATMSGQKRDDSNGFPMQCLSLPEISGVSNNCAFKSCEKDAMPPQKLCHPIKFESVYGNATFEGRKVISTHHQDSGNPDFMFYSVKSKVYVDDNTQDVTENDLFLYRRLSLPDVDALKRYCEPFPNSMTGSDHIPLLGDFFLP